VGERVRAIAPYAIILAVAVTLFEIASAFTYARQGDRLGPEVWPRAILALMILVCVVRIVGLLWRSRADDAAAPAAVPGDAPAHPPVPGDALAAVDVASRHEQAIEAPVGAVGLADASPADAPTPRQPLRLVAGIASTVVYVLLMPVLGFALATACYIAGMCRVGDYRNWRVIVPTALIGSVLFMLVFQRIVYLSLPLGRPPFEAVSLVLMQLMGIR
jgi:putative tricarboxylic transport membrane protein